MGRNEFASALACAAGARHRHRCRRRLRNLPQWAYSTVRGQLSNSCRQYHGVGRYQWFGQVAPVQSHHGPRAAVHRSCPDAGHAQLHLGLALEAGYQTGESPFQRTSSSPCSLDNWMIWNPRSHATATTRKAWQSSSMPSLPSFVRCSAIRWIRRGRPSCGRRCNRPGFPCEPRVSVADNPGWPRWIAGRRGSLQVHSHLILVCAAR